MKHAAVSANVAWSSISASTTSTTSNLLRQLFRCNTDLPSSLHEHATSQKLKYHWHRKVERGNVICPEYLHDCSISTVLLGTRRVDLAEDNKEENRRYSGFWGKRYPETRRPKAMLVGFGVRVVFSSSASAASTTTTAPL